MPTYTPYPTQPQWPTNFQGATVVGQFIGLDGVPISGHLTLTASADVLLDTANHVVIPAASRPVTVTLSSSGQIVDGSGNPGLILPATDDPDILPTGWTYHVVESWAGGRTYDIALPQNTTVDLSAVTSTTPGVTGLLTIPLPTGTPVAGQSAVVATAAPLTMAWGNVRTTSLMTPAVIGGYVTSATSQQSSTGTARVPYYTTTAVTDLRLVYTNWILSGINDADPTSSLTVSASVEYSGTIYRTTFGGATTVTVNPGGAVTGDPLALDLPAGALVWVRTYTSGANWYGNRSVNATGFGGFTATTDLTAPGSAAITDASTFTNLIGPAAILGNPLTAGAVPPTVLGIGDSIMWGYGDQAGTGVGGLNTSNTNLGFGGFIARACNTGHAGLVNVGVANDTAQNFLTPAGHLRRMSLAHRCTTAVVQYGRNDLTGGRTLAQIQADLIAVWTMLFNRRLRVLQTTITPRTTSTDAWRTTGSQTAGTGEANRTALNDWLRAGAPISGGAAVTAGTSGATLAGTAGHPLYGVHDVADQVESARNSGLWAAATNVRTAADGAWASGTTITGTATFTTADVGRTVTLAGAGAAGALYVGKVKSVTNATTIVVITAPSTVVSGAALTVGDYYTQDGIHPEPVAHALMATAVDTTKFL